MYSQVSIKGEDGEGRYLMWGEEVTVRLGLFRQMRDKGNLFTMRDVDLVCGTLAAVLVLLLCPQVSRPKVVLLRHLNVIILAFMLVCLCRTFPYHLATFIHVIIRVSLLTC